MQKSEIANLSLEVVQDPGNNMENISKILKIASSESISPDMRKIAILSLTEIFRDICPSYRIASNRSEKINELSKAVAARRNLEEQTLKHYKRFLLFLIRNLRESARNSSKKIEKTKKNESFSNKKLLIFSLCALLKALESFNFHEMVVRSLFTYLGNAKVDPSNLIGASFCEIFKKSDVDLISFLAGEIAERSVKKDFSVPLESFSVLKLFDPDRLESLTKEKFEADGADDALLKKDKEGRERLVLKVWDVYEAYFSKSWETRKKIFPFVSESFIVHAPKIFKKTRENVASLLVKIMRDKNVSLKNFIFALNASLLLSRISKDSIETDFTEFVIALKAKIAETKNSKNPPEKLIGAVTSEIGSLLEDDLKKKRFDTGGKSLKLLEEAIKKIKLRLISGE